MKVRNQRMSHYDIISHATIQKECFDLYISLLHLMVVILCNENPFKHHPMSYRIFDHMKRNHVEMVDVFSVCIEKLFWDVKINKSLCCS